MTLKNMCRWNGWKMTKFRSGYHGNASTNPLLANDVVVQQGIEHYPCIWGDISRCFLLREPTNFDFCTKIMMLNSQFPQLAKWQPYNEGQKPKYILKRRHVATERKKNQTHRYKTDSWTARWTWSILDDFGRVLAEIISFSSLAPKVLEIEIRRNVIKCSTHWALSLHRISRF